MLAKQCMVTVYKNYVYILCIFLSFDWKFYTLGLNFMNVYTSSTSNFLLFFSVNIQIMRDISTPVSKSAHSKKRRLDRKWIQMMRDRANMGGFYRKWTFYLSKWYPFTSSVGFVPFRLFTFNNILHIMSQKVLTLSPYYCCHASFINLNEIFV